MHLLLTNDDGIHHPGLLALKQALAPLGEITVVAPSRNFSAAGHRKTLHKPMRIDATHLADGSPAWMCSGAPSDCVALALLGFVKTKVDFVVSGINPYFNRGQDVTYSGTVTAALEGLIAGVPSLAVSTEAKSVADFDYVGQTAARILQAAVAHQLPAGVALNINVPTTPPRGIRITRLGTSIYRDALDARTDPSGRAYYWIGGQPPLGQVEEEGTDFWAVANGYVSVTPLHLDLTAHAMRKNLEAWDLK